MLYLTFGLCNDFFFKVGSLRFLTLFRRHQQKRQHVGSRFRQVAFLNKLFNGFSQSGRWRRWPHMLAAVVLTFAGHMAVGNSRDRIGDSTEGINAQQG